LAVIGTKLFAGGDGGVFLSDTDGKRWTGPLVNNLNVLSLTISDSNLFAGTAEGGIFASANGGRSWTMSSTGYLSYEQVNSIITSGANVFAGAEKGVFRSTNNGVSWDQVNQIPYIKSLAIIGTNLFAGADGSGVFRSIDDGSSWTCVDSGLTNLYGGLLAVSGTNLFVGTHYGGVFLSTDYGTSWSQVDSGLTDAYVWSLASVGTDLFVSTNNGVFLSTNNGRNWTSTGLVNTVVHALAMLGSTLLAGTGGGGVFHSTDNGTSWTPVNLGLLNNYVNSFAIIGQNLFAGTSGSGVWRRALSDLTSLVTKLFELPNEYELKQNYPNPFNPSTVIVYQLPVNSVVTVKVYDVLGRAVETLVNERESAGTHSVKFNAANLPSGVYFYRLEAGGYHDTKKLLLLK
jgi:hypothetical protein